MEKVLNCKITDMLKKQNPGTRLSADSDHLKIRESKTKGRYIEGLESYTVIDKEKALEMIHEGTKRRTVNATAFNEKSSRSHLIFCLTLTVSSSELKDKVSKLYMIDLAGSEGSSVSIQKIPANSHLSSTIKSVCTDHW